MLKKYLALVLCFGFLGCSTVERFKLNHQYTAIYNNGINTNEVTSVVTHEDYQELKQRLAGYLSSSGYTRVIFENPQHGFMVLAKEEILHPYQIILKYTRTAGEFKTHIDLVKGSNDLGTDSMVKEDIQEIADQIKNN